ncbi:MAG TPA: hypothetical protein RMF84_04790 [Polyangiaceae bacterium LLY-WYZ-14_1]|nr:hypothetical protein [Polyangiaceae bacterium LLY-WYZ-14_1]
MEKRVTARLPRRRFLTCVAIALGVPTLASGCTDAGIQPADLDEAERFDNLLDINGEFCTQPDTTVNFPVKVLFAVDQSSSLQLTDPMNLRLRAVQGLMDDLIAEPDTEIGFLGFANWSRERPFTRDLGTFADILADGNGVATDYQGALSSVVRILENDMVAVGQAVRARTRYVVVFVSDGIAEPRCRAGCEDDETTCANGEDDDADGRVDGADDDCDGVGDRVLRPDTLYGICNFTEDLDEVLDPDEYVDFDGRCPAYNQTDQILDKVRDVLRLRDTYSVGSINLNTVLLFQPNPALQAQFGYDLDEARAVLRAMAREGGGVFRDVNLATADEDEFLDFDFRALEAPQALSGLQVVNDFAEVGPVGYLTDEDRDGLPDDVEIELGTDLRNPDSDVGGGDGYTDLFEQRFRDRGYDPLDPAVPAVPCRQQGDLDGDGLRDCEEEALETDVRNADTDGDNVLDYQEVLAGTDPTVADGLEDLDFDGVLNIEEVVGGTNALVPDEDRYRDERIQYRFIDRGRRMVEDFETGRVEERQCYGFEIRNLQMVVTPVVGQRGLNRFLIYAQEQPTGLNGARSETQVACFEAFYRGELSKDPESGVIDASEEGWFRTLSELQARIDNLASCPWIGEGFNRRTVERVVAQCLPETVALGRYASTTDQSVSLIREYVAGNTGVNVPQPSSELFVPLPLFNPDTDCWRPWELDRLDALFALIETACACQEPIQQVTSDGVLPFTSTCCPMTPEP